MAKVRLHFPRAVPGAVTRAGGWCLTRRLDYDPCHVQFRDDAMRQAWTPRPGDADYFFAYRTPPRLMRRVSAYPAGKKRRRALSVPRVRPRRLLR